jgi:hypothetical protein
MKYTILIIIVLLISVYLILIDSDQKSFEQFICPEIQRAICHYIDKEYLPSPNYYMNHRNFMKNILPVLNTNNRKLYVKKGEIHNIRKNLDYYFSKYNNPEKNINVEMSKNKHIDLVINHLRNNKVGKLVKINLILSFFDLTKNKKNDLDIVFIPYIIKENKPIINILTTSGKLIKLIGLYNLNGERIDFSNIRDHKTIDINNYNLDTKFTKAEIRKICKDELSIMCKNNFEYLNDSLDFYEQNTPTTTSTTLPESCDIFSRDTKYLDNNKFSFY